MKYGDKKKNPVDDDKNTKCGTCSMDDMTVMATCINHMAYMLEPGPISTMGLTGLTARFRLELS